MIKIAVRGVRPVQCNGLGPDVFSSGAEGDITGWGHILCGRPRVKVDVVTHSIAGSGGITRGVVRTRGVTPSVVLGGDGRSR